METSQSFALETEEAVTELGDPNSILIKERNLVSNVLISCWQALPYKTIQKGKPFLQLEKCLKIRNNLQKQKHSRDTKAKLFTADILTDDNLLKI